MTTKEITLDENGFATEAGYITVYNYSGETREFISSSVEYLPFGVGVRAIPALMHQVASVTVSQFAAILT